MRCRDTPPPYFEGGESISEALSSWFDDMFEKFRILLKFWPFSVGATRLVTGDEVAQGTSPAPLFLVVCGVSIPSPHFKVGESIFGGFGLWSFHMLRQFSIFGARCMLWVQGCLHGPGESCPKTVP